MDRLKQVACTAIDREAENLQEISSAIWHHKELGMEEHKSHLALTQFLENRGFQVERHFKMATAFVARFGSLGGQKGEGHSRREPHVAFLCEYDALPNIGHACGHNLIAALGLAAGVGVKVALEDTRIPGQISIIGTPAEESHGGKIDLLEHGVFDDVDVAMMAHPAPFSDVRPIFLGISDVRASFKGKASHAAGFPWEGINALDGAVLAYMNIAALRQQLKPSWRVHTIFTKAGTKANIIPDEAELWVSMRTPVPSEHEELEVKVQRCVKAAADASGCAVEIHRYSRPYKCLVTNETLARLYESNATSIGIEIPVTDTKQMLGSTDMGDVSQTVPSLHPCFNIGTTAVNHTEEFSQAALSDEAQHHTLNQGKLLAMVALDILQNPQLLQSVKEDFDQQFKQRCF